MLPQLPITRKGLTEFTFSRFLCPSLCDYQGISIFLDADMLVLCDIYEIIAQHDVKNAVSVAQHQQHFEWASLMIFTNSACRKLTAEWVENKDNNPFKFAWAPSLGNIDPQYNHCVGYDTPTDDAKLVHFTQGIPCFPETKDCEYAAQWDAELRACLHTVSWKEIMGPSVHAQPVLKRLHEKNRDLQPAA